MLRLAFKFGHNDYPDRHNPTAALKSARIRKKDRATIDPFSIRDAEAISAAIHQGLQRGEVLKLRWTSTDFGRRLLTVEGPYAQSGKDLRATAQEPVPIGCWARAPGCRKINLLVE